MPRLRIPGRPYLLPALNLLLGLILWFFHVSDYSLAGTWTDLFFLLAVALLAPLSWIWEVRRGRRGCRRGLLYLPALSAGCLPILIVVPVLILTLPLGGIFALFWGIDEELHARVVQQAVSPDGAWIAEVHFRPVGPYSGGSGRVKVAARPRWLPIVERTLFGESESWIDPDNPEYIVWIDDETLRITEPRREEPVEVHVPDVDFGVPGWLLFPVSAVLFFFYLFYGAP